MSRFEQLQAAYSDATAANHRYWSQMHQVIRGLPKDFCEYLGVDSNLNVPLGGAGVPAVTIGSSDDKNDFLPWAVDMLPRSGQAIECALRLTFGNQANSTPPPVFVAYLSIAGIGDDLFVVKVRGQDESEFKGPVFTELFESLFRRAMITLGA